MRKLLWYSLSFASGVVTAIMVIMSVVMTIAFKVILNISLFVAEVCANSLQYTSDGVLYMALATDKIFTRARQ